VKIENKRVKFDYQVVDTIEVGIVLLGTEVKSVKLGRVNLAGARVVERGGEMWVVGMTIDKYPHGGRLEENEPQRTRKLLLKKRERIGLEVKSRSEGLTMVPRAVYNKGGLIKLEVALVRGKKKFEKREVLKARAIEKKLRQFTS